MANIIHSTSVLPLDQVLKRHFSQTNESQVAFAERAGVSQGILSRYISGERYSLNRSTAEKLAKVLGIPIEDILESVKVAKANNKSTKNTISQDKQRKLSTQENIPDLFRKYINNKQTEDSQIFFNLGQDVIIIKEEILRLYLMAYLKNMETKRVWIAPLGIFLTTSLTLTSANFRNFLYIEAATWKAIFILSALGSLGWLILSLIKTLKSKSLEDLIEDIKQCQGNPERNQNNNSMSLLLKRLEMLIQLKK